MTTKRVIICKKFVAINILNILYLLTSVIILPLLISLGFVHIIEDSLPSILICNFSWCF